MVADFEEVVSSIAAVTPPDKRGPLGELGAGWLHADTVSALARWRRNPRILVLGSTRARALLTTRFTEACTVTARAES